MHRPLLLTLALALMGCVDPADLDGLVVALPPSTPDNLNITPIVVVAPLATQVQYRYAWESDSTQFPPGDFDEQDIVGSWATRPGETWTVTVIPHVGSQEGPPAVSTTLITDAGRDSDNDGDGVTENQGDCDDANASIFPGTDRDNDGFPGCLFNFQPSADRDCDDTDPLINPGRSNDDDAVRPLEDDDCDGLLDEDAVEEGEIAVVELLGDPSEDGGAWMELLNTSEVARELMGWSLVGDEVATLPAARLLPGARGLLCPNPGLATAQGLDCLNTAPFDGDALSSSSLALGVQGNAPSLRLRFVLPLDALPTAPGVATQLGSAADPSAQPAEPGAWCLATSPLASGDLGTPGDANQPCP